MKPLCISRGQTALMHRARLLVTLMEEESIQNLSLFFWVGFFFCCWFWVSFGQKCNNMLCRCIYYIQQDTNRELYKVPMTCLLFRRCLCLMWWAHCAWFVTPVWFSAEIHWWKTAAHCTKQTGLLAGSFWVNDTYPSGSVRPWWTCIKGFSELLLGAWCELYGAGVSARGRRRLVSHFTAESHPPSRLLFMCFANMNPTGNRRLSEALW